MSKLALAYKILITFKDTEGSTVNVYIHDYKSSVGDEGQTGHSFTYTGDYNNAHTYRYRRAKQIAEYLSESIGYHNENSSNPTDKKIVRVIGPDTDEVVGD